jgi:alpha-L-arabinofuranosidase
MRRRNFLKGAAFAGAGVLLSSRSMWAASADSRIEILLDEPIGTIAPEIYGQFTEHLGGVIYDGIWVGEKSSIPNIGGIRKQIVEALRSIRVPVIRWPGGCFADSYDWRDGIGPRDKRPRRTNFWVDDADARRLHGRGVQLYEDNAFGTDEFARFCKLSGAQPYLAANLRSLTPLDFDRWIEYCNSPAGSTTLAEQRAANGSPEPYNVRYWGVGNESWGCGGNFTPEEYATEFRRFISWTPSYGVDLAFVASGPNENDLDWSRRFFETLTRGRPYFPDSLRGWSVHYYTWNLSRGKTKDWVAGKRDALNFDNTDWYELLQQGSFMEKIVEDQWAVLGMYDPSHRVKLVVDEYGPWYRPGTEVDSTHLLGQQVTLRDALHTAMTLDIFNRHADKVGMAACAQLVNCLNALFLTHEDKFALTPNFHVFEMYTAHHGAQALRADFLSPSVHYLRDGKDAEMWGLHGSASRRANNVTLTVVNPNLNQARETQINLRTGTVSSAKATVLTSSDPHAHSTLEQTDVVHPKTMDVQVSGGLLNLTFPPASVSKIEISL